MAPSRPRTPSPDAARPNAADDLNRGDEARPGTPGSGESVCRKCRGTGRIDGARCADCGGTGRVVEGIGGA